MDSRMPTELVSNALTMAVNARGGDGKGMIFHGDRGAQYMSHDYGSAPSSPDIGCEHHAA